MGKEGMGKWDTRDGRRVRELEQRTRAGQDKMSVPVQLVQVGGSDGEKIPTVHVRREGSRVDETRCGGNTGWGRKEKRCPFWCI